MIERCAAVYASFLMLVVASNDFAAPTVNTPQQDRRNSNAEEPVRLSASLVQVPAIVTDRSGKFVSDLSQSDFTVLEDGKRQEIAVFGAVKQPLTRSWF